MIELYVTQQVFDQSERLFREKQAAGISLQFVDTARLEQLVQSTEHQGLVARLGPFPYYSLKTFLPILTSTVSFAPIVVMCDRIQDAFNFGAILRCCDGANVVGVIVGEKSQAEVTPHVARASSGAVNHIPVVRVENLVETAESIKQIGFQFVAADSNATMSVWHSALSKPTMLLIGSEARGISSDLLAICDLKVCIPMQGKVTSLNAAVAAGILLYEIRRQQSMMASPSRDL